MQIATEKGTSLFLAAAVLLFSCWSRCGILTRIESMADLFDSKTLERLRSLSPREAFDEAKSAVYRLGGVTSDDFLDVFEELVDKGILSWEQIEEFEQN